MFERNRVDNMAQAQQVGVPAEVSLDDGSVLKGRFLVSASRPVYEVLNGPAPFLEFQEYGGEASLIAKTTIRAIKLVNAPNAQQLRTGTRGEAFDPHQILGVTADATEDEVRKAYHELAKVYHPDRYATAILPAEVRDYLAVTVRRINLAFQALDRARIAASQRPAARSAPVYTSPADRARA